MLDDKHCTESFISIFEWRGKKFFANTCLRFLPEKFEQQQFELAFGDVYMYEGPDKYSMLTNYDQAHAILQECLPQLRKLAGEWGVKHGYFSHV